MIVCKELETTVSDWKNPLVYDCLQLEICPIIRLEKNDCMKTIENDRFRLENFSHLRLFTIRNMSHNQIGKKTIV